MLNYFIVQLEDYRGNSLTPGWIIGEKFAATDQSCNSDGAIEGMGGTDAARDLEIIQPRVLTGGPRGRLLLPAPACLNLIQG